MRQLTPKSGLSRIQFNSIQSLPFLVTLQVLLLILLSTSAIGQNIFPVAAPWETGIGSALIGTFPNQFPQKPLHLHTFPGFGRHPFAPPLISNDPAFRISSGPNLNTNTNWGHLVLITAQNDIGDPGIGGNKYYSNVANYNSTTELGDFVLEASYKSEDLVLVARSATGKIRLATSPFNNADVERMTIWPNGKIIINPLQNDVISPIGDFSIKLSEGLNTVQIPNISFVGDGTTRLNPEICFYRTFGGNLPAHSWRIGNEQDGAHYINLTFKSSTETVTPGGTDDINGTGTDKLKRLVEFQNNGSVVFSGPDVDPVFRNIGRPLGAGTRFYWERQKGAIRAGYVDGTQWDFDNIGMYSAAFGNSNIVTGENSIASGITNEVSGNSSSAFGSSNTVSGNDCFTAGNSNSVSGQYSSALGFTNTVNQANSYAIGYECYIDGPYSIALGHIATASNGTDCIAIGNHALSDNNHAFTFGSFVEANGAFSTAMGNNTKTDGKTGAFIIGDSNLDPLSGGKTLSVNDNEISLRFIGDYNDTTPGNYAFRLITGVAGVAYTGICTYHKSSSWYMLCDSNTKDNIQKVNEIDVLNHLRQVPVKTWKYKSDLVYKDSVQIYDSLSYKWMSPMAQDFYREFPLGVPDSSKLSSLLMESAMFASIQALADITDSLTNGMQKQSGKAVDLENKMKSFVSMSEFQGLKDTLYCYKDACKRIEALETVTRNLVTINEFNYFKDSIAEKNSEFEQKLDTKLSIDDFNSFKDSISCYKDACKLIDELTEKLKELQTRFDSLEAKYIAPPNDKNQSDAMQSFNSFSDIILEQNRPNPFEENTVISYFIPKKYNGMSKLIIANENGTEIFQNFEICNGKPCQLTISSKDLQIGVYIYGIEINGRIVRANKMMIIK